MAQSEGARHYYCLSGGPVWTVPELVFEKKQLIPALQQLVLSYRGKGT